MGSGRCRKPAGANHGGPDAAVSHAGDFGNLLADASGNAMISMLSKHVSLADGPEGIIGRAIIIHESVDDLSSQPGGNAGARIACGIVERVVPEGAAPPELAAPAAASAPAEHDDHSHADGSHDN